MAKLEYDESGRLLFTKEMKEEYTVLFPMMLPIHFTLLEKILRNHGLKAELLKTTHPQIVNYGLQNVHNDTCYPALLVIGQFMDALNSGKYDLHKTALMITQTGGGCRASNYIHLLRKALKKNNLDFVPVISFNIAGMEKNPGFKMSLGLISEMASAVIYGDLLMLLSNQTRPYEIHKGESDALIEEWVEKLTHESMNALRLKKNLYKIAESFSKIRIKKVDKVKVGVVGEIFIKYAPLGNNNLEDFLRKEDCETVVPGLLDFVIFMCDHHIDDVKFYHIRLMKGFASKLMKKLFTHLQNQMISVLKQFPQFRCPAPFDEIKSYAGGYVSSGNKMGEGWLLTAEMLELIHSGVENIVCTQPFGCLPNHIVGKGMIRKIREQHPQSNIVAIDYDPGATKINQENRIKLMLSMAKEKADSALRFEYVEPYFSGDTDEIRAAQ
ncbi:2-hydroxyacyl-CoA dehydratase [Candidatus Soleaferrea massiliensis]|uniref:2-hydroxyacyl-CoA dehydratase n=1 Tax=Candidatus Soleaferrea massiliensis TaxID=1470354 RepID=UPI0009E4DB37|nr:2-hydroxyacyl-CoA dehydratase [Candidatus Soleaferrea massiliensis]